MKGDVPVAYIIALILGIAVLVALGYWFYTTGGKIGPTLSQQECQMRFQQNCEAWKNSGYPEKMTVKVKCDDNGAKALANVIGLAACGGDYCNCGDTAKCKNCPGTWQNVDLEVNNGNWWNYIAPGCAEAYGIQIKDRSDCP
jgi:hypothetical protein